MEIVKIILCVKALRCYHSKYVDNSCNFSSLCVNLIHNFLILNTTDKENSNKTSLVKLIVAGSFWHRYY